MSVAEPVIGVAPPEGRRGKRGEFVFSTDRKRSRIHGPGTPYSIQIADMTELRRRNKLACARVVTEEDEKAHKKTAAPQADAALPSKSEKLFRQRKVRTRLSFLFSFL